MDLLHNDRYESLREAAEVHRQVRSFANSIIKPGIRLIDMCEQIEEMNRKLVKENGMEVRCPPSPFSSVS